MDKTTSDHDEGARAGNGRVGIGLMMSLRRAARIATTPEPTGEMGAGRNRWQMHLARGVQSMAVRARLLPHAQTVKRKHKTGLPSNRIVVTK
jgi:hypothetical protein